MGDWRPLLVNNHGLCVPISLTRLFKSEQLIIQQFLQFQVHRLNNLAAALPMLILIDSFVN